jgi:Matrixin
MNMRSYHLVIFLILVTLFLPTVQGQQAYVQPMFQVSWTNRTIFISVPNSPASGKAAFEFAAQVWNQAQTWFMQSYEPNRPNAVYTLAIAQSGEVAQVTVQYSSSNPNDYWAVTSAEGTRISIILSKFGTNPTTSDLEPVAIHELGHVLGLGDNNIEGDMMRSTGPYPYVPSTLDLYAAYLEAASGNSYGNGDTVRLPSQIPYLTWYPGEAAVPEFPVPALTVFVLISGVMFFLKARRQKD